MPREALIDDHYGVCLRPRDEDEDSSHTVAVVCFAQRRPILMESGHVGNREENNDRHHASSAEQRSQSNLEFSLVYLSRRDVLNVLKLSSAFFVSPFTADGDIFSFASLIQNTHSLVKTLKTQA